MIEEQTRRGVTRRELLKRSAAVSATLVVGAGYVASVDAAWALETQALKPETMATLIQMARDIYPHDHVADEFYAACEVGWRDTLAAIEQRVAAMG